MSRWDVILLLAALMLGAIVMAAVQRRRRRDEDEPTTRVKILFPFVGAGLSERALQAALRLARAEHAVVVPAYLATVPLPLTLDAPVARACDEAFEVFEEIERRATAYGVPVDGRVVRGRTPRHALRQLMAEVPGGARIVVPAASGGEHDGFSVDDVAWLLRHAPTEVLVVRPGPAGPTASGVPAITQVPGGAEAPASLVTAATRATAQRGSPSARGRASDRPP
jgi:nucleotide-binding universal stress UspA family protein